MVQVIEQTQEEKMAMYMKLSKKEIAAMLIQANNHLAILMVPNPVPVPWVAPIVEWPPFTMPQPPFYTTCGDNNSIKPNLDLNPDSEHSSTHYYIY